jgi:UDP-N-acetylmuramate: L-alanyl-gamma-D-glutamyl-meso-diaminopimelate ligase
LPEAERLSPQEVVDAVRAAGKDARFIPDVEQIVSAVARDARPGDLVIVMSNGGFENIHQRLLTALAARVQ